MKDKRDAVIVAMGRTAIGDFGGSLAKVRAHDLAAQVIKSLLEKTGVDPAQFDDVILGDCVQCPDEANTARTAMLKAGIPVEVPAVTIQRQCSSAMQALGMAATYIKVGDYDLVVAGGVESMSNAPYVSYDTRWGARLTHKGLQDAMWEMLHSGSPLLDPPGYIMGQTAENLARKYDISREDQDVVALRSHNNAEAAIAAGKFTDEIVPIPVPQRKGEPKLFDTDEHVRRGLTMGDLSRLKPAFAKDGTVTAGNASGLNDGAAVCIVASRAKAEEMGLTPLAKIHSFAAAGCPPEIMGWGPVPATQKLLKKTGVSLSDIELIELNEAFAAQYLACERGLELNRDITNVNGSGVGLGHPVGCTGARIVISLLGEMKRRGLSLGLATLCVGGGMGMSMLVENE
ncbi:acetyl-CoA acetyltransferase [Desulfoferula mesophila]|uniref:Acetyl-CoA acetyltransferase n=2 Tax=Desulfoferula mesophila TaxID=3058419 RepID=A0AAU9EEP3_9BACT|nr:acetyl-CoA acetyltransferase [Desulfoferula mesophilus]